MANSTTTNALVELKEKFTLQINMDSQEIRDRYYGGEGASRDAFEELCALYDAIQVLNVSFSLVFQKFRGKYFFPSMATP